MSTETATETAPAPTLKDSLYDIAAAVHAALAILDEADGEIPEGFEAVLDAVQGNFIDKLDNVLRFRAGRVARAEGLKVEMDRLQAQYAAEVRKAEWLKQYVFQCLMAAGQQKVETKLFKLRIQKNSRPSIHCLSLPDLPIQYTRTTVSFNGEQAYLDWKNGVALPEVVRVVEGAHLRIS